MSQSLPDRIVTHLKSGKYRPQKPRGLARDLKLTDDEHYPEFRNALKQLMREGRVAIGAGGSVVVPSEHVRRDVIVGTYRHNRKGFGFVVPRDPDSHEDLYIPEGENRGAITGDLVSAKIISRGRKGEKQLLTGRVQEIVERTHKRFVGTLGKPLAKWIVVPDGNVLTDPIETPDAASRHIRPGTKVVVELTSYPAPDRAAQGVIVEVLGREGEKDVDLRGVMVQYGLPREFPEAVVDQARRAIDQVDWNLERSRRLDLSDQTVITIDPDDAKDYDDAISLRQVEGGHWELGVHIADVAHFIPAGSALDAEAKQRGNSTYFPGFVIPMLPEILSNGVCSLQEGVPRLCKSAFITLDEQAKPIRTRFANTLITSAKRLRYREAQALIDHAARIPHPDGEKRRGDYPPRVLQLLTDMDQLAKRIQKRRHAAGQIVLELPEIALVLDEQGRVVDATSEDTSFTHTIIEMFMVEANEAAARLLSRQGVPFLRRIHPGPGDDENLRLREFVNVAGFQLPKQLDRRAIQSLLHTVKGQPASYAINLAVLKSLSRAEYSPDEVGHFALASEDYSHFTSPIRRYADLTIHRLLHAYCEQATGRGGRHAKVDFTGAPSRQDLVELGRHISFTERRSEDAERELRRVKVLTLLQKRLGEEFAGVVTGITNFGVFVQLREWLIEGLIRYEHLLDDWWDVNERAGEARGQRTGARVRIGDPLRVRIGKVDLPRRELDLAIVELPRKGGAGPAAKARPKHFKPRPHKRHRRR